MIPNIQCPNLQFPIFNSNILLQEIISLPIIAPFQGVGVLLHSQFIYPNLNE